MQQINGSFGEIDTEKKNVSHFVLSKTLVSASARFCLVELSLKRETQNLPANRAYPRVQWILILFMLVDKRYHKENKSRVLIFSVLKITSNFS